MSAGVLLVEDDEPARTLVAANLRSHGYVVRSAADGEEALRLLADDRALEAQRAGFRESFAFAGESADRGYNLLVFPEGGLTLDGTIQPFRAGIGLLASGVRLPVVPLRIDGLFALRQARRKTARPGQVRVTIGEPVRFEPETDPEEIARELERRVVALGDGNL